MSMRYVSHTFFAELDFASIRCETVAQLVIVLTLLAVQRLCMHAGKDFEYEANFGCFRESTIKKSAGPDNRECR